MVLSCLSRTGAQTAAGPYMVFQVQVWTLSPEPISLFLSTETGGEGDSEAKCSRRLDEIWDGEGGTFNVSVT